MTPVVTREYKPEDYFAVEAQEFSRGELSEEEKVRTSVTHKYAGPHYTITTEEGEVIACVGIHRMWEGTGEVWGLFSSLMRKYLMAWFEVKKVLKFEQKNGAYRRLQAIARCDWPEALRLVEHLGFHAEGRLEAYGPWGADSMMYALIERS